MEIAAISRGVKTSPRKVRLVADSIRGLSLRQAINALSVVQKIGATALTNTLESALSNAINNAKKNEGDLFVKSIEIFEGPAIKRFHFSTRGRVHPYKKRTSHIKIVLKEKNERSKYQNPKSETNSNDKNSK